MSTATPPGRHEREEAPQSLWAEFKDAVSTRTVGLIVGVLLLQLGFILSYVGAFHAPTPHQIPIAIVSPSAQVTDQTVARINGIAGAPLRAVAVADRPAAQQRLRAGDLTAALILDPQGTADTLLVSSGGGVAASTAVSSVIGQIETGQQRTVTTQDVVPLQSGDGRGLTGFYLVIGWIVGGYLVAALLGVSAGARPATPRRAYFRLAAVVPYSILSGLGGVLVVDQVLGALTGHFFALWWLGALVVASAATVTLAFQVLFGVLGIGITVLVFVILGNPSAGGAYQTSLLPTFWRTIGNALPNGAGTDTVRRIVYLESNGIAGHLLVIAVYVVAGAAVALAGSHLLHRRARTARGLVPGAVGTVPGAAGEA